MEVRIIGTGAHIPNREHKNNQFLDNQFFDANGESIPNNNEEIIEKFSSITGIRVVLVKVTHQGSIKILV